jgi:AcrR family transcriptional regulator
MRADARRNRQRVLDAAADVFAAHGADVPIDLIAREAGVGPGTLYRHFPTKEALFEAVMLDRFAQLTAEARALLSAPDPGPAFLSYIERVVVQAADQHDLVDVLTRAGFDMQSVKSQVGAELRDAIDALLQRAQASGAVRGDVRIAELMVLIGGIALSSRTSPGDPSLLADVICDGLRTNAETRRPRRETTVQRA